MPRSNLRVILPCFFLSGVAGLIYEVAWTKALGLVFGHTVYAIATVLAAFMAGLAAGSAYLGKWGGRHPRPTLLYGWLELLIAATGALSLLGVSAVRILYVAAYHSVSGSMPVLETLRFAASILVLFLPTFLMGGTLPILAMGVTHTSSETSTRLSRLYWVNTAGAVIGALAAGFLLLPSIGLRLTVGVAVLCNVLAGCLALAFASSLSELSEPVPAETPAPQEARSATVATPAFVLVSFALVGATAMAYEISWTRLLATTLGSSTYAFTVMLATFLAGIAIGSRLFESWVSRGKEVSLATFGNTQTLTGLCALFFLVLFNRLPAMSWWMIVATHKHFGGLILTQFVICALAMLPAAVVFGFNFPAVILLIAGGQERTSSYAERVGRACAANTVGAIGGSVAAGFWLVPLLGSFRLVAMTAAVNLVLAVFLLARRQPRRTTEIAVSAVLATIVATAGWSGFLYDPALANFSVVNHPETYPAHLTADEIARSVDLLFSEDGLNASVAVVRSENSLALKTNGKTDASSSDRISQLMLGHLGMIDNKAPRKVLIIGFGSGMTVSAVARYPEVQQIDCVEIEPAMLHAAAYLDPLNRGVLSDPRLHIITDDARNFLFTTRNRYDVIISEPSNPWIAGIAALFTDEFYAEVRSRLAPGGLLIQWVQAYSLFPQDVKMVLGALAPHFSQISVWRGNRGDLILLAQADPGKVELGRLRQIWSVPALREDYAMLGLGSPEGLIAYHLLDDADLRTLVANAPRNTDDLTRLEYRAPLAIFADGTIAENVEMFAHQRSTLLPVSVDVTGDAATLFAAAQTSMSFQDYDRAGLYISALANTPATADSEMLRGSWLEATKDFTNARAAFENAQRLNPSSFAAIMGLAQIDRETKDYDGSEYLLREILDKQPGYIPALESYAVLEADRGNWKEALQWQTKRVLADPSRPFVALILLADLFVHTGDYQNAEHLYVDLLNRDPYNGYVRTGLGKLYQSEKRWDEARVQLEVVERYFPNASPDLYLTLADVYKNLGRPQEAESILHKGQRIFPGEASLINVASAN